MVKMAPKVRREITWLAQAQAVPHGRMQSKPAIPRRAVKLLAAQRWLWELADIYENAFGRPARVSGSGGGPVGQRGKFYRLLELSRPSSFPRHGTLSPRQIDRTLEERRKYNHKQIDIREAMARLATEREKSSPIADRATIKARSGGRIALEVEAAEPERAETQAKETEEL
jgi:hypothetical protein